MVLKRLSKPWQKLAPSLKKAKKNLGIYLSMNNGKVTSMGWSSDA